jgi:Spy/CpxP family protein refolding chaperone
MNYRNTLIAAAMAALVPLAGTALAKDNDKSGMKSGTTGARF